MSQWNEGIKTYTSGEALEEGCRVKISSSTVVYADAGEDFIGVTLYAVATSTAVAVKLRNYPGTFKVQAAGAFSVNAKLYGAADGCVDDAISGAICFLALEAATAAGDLVETLPYPDGASIGVWNDSGVVGYGVALSSTNQFAAGVYADDGGTALTAGWYAAAFDQFLLDTTYTDSRNVSAFGHCGELHLGVSITPGGNYAGEFAYAEIETGKTWTAADNLSFSGLLAGLDVPSGAIIAANSTASCIAMGGNFGGTHTGKLVGVHVTNPSAGAYDYLFQFGWSNAAGDSTGLIETITANTGKMTKGIKVRSGTTEYWVVCQTATS